MRWVATLTVLLWASLAYADLMIDSGEGTWPSGATWNWTREPDYRIVDPSPLSSEDIERFLTFLGQVPDFDKDGFVESEGVGDANPMGYVVFNFRFRSLNERIVLGRDQAGLPDAHLYSLAGGSDAPRVWDWPLADPTGPVPEPVAAAVLAVGAAGLLRRRGRRS